MPPALNVNGANMDKIKCVTIAPEEELKIQEAESISFVAKSATIQQMIDILNNYSDVDEEIVEAAIKERALRLEVENEIKKNCIKNALDLLSICNQSYTCNKHLLNEWEQVRLEEIRGAIKLLSDSEANNG